MHTVLTTDCTGCDLCVEPCPVDCIDMIPVTQNLKNWNWRLNAIPVTLLQETGDNETMLEEDKRC